jgi:hypothetical protein
MTQSGYYESHAKSLTSAPSVLHVCHESRKVAIRNNLYQRAFVYGQSYVWVNFAFDTISLKPFQCTYFVEERALIQRLRIEDQHDDGSSFHYFKTQILRTFPSLKEINIICLDPVAHWVNILENCWLGTDNVTLSRKGDQSGRVYTMQELFKMYPSKRIAECSDSETRQKFDARIKGPEAGAPKYPIASSVLL